MKQLDFLYFVWVNFTFFVFHPEYHLNFISPSLEATVCA